MIGTVYKLTDKDGKVYYGSTKNTLHQRLCEHRAPSSKKCMSRTMDKESMTIGALEEYYFDEDTYNKKFMLKRERYYIDNNLCINRMHPTRTKKEYRKDNKEFIATNKKKHYQKNKQSILEKHKEYNLKNKQSILEYKKQYYENNKQSILENRKERYQNNKESINEKQKEKLGCRICRRMVNRSNFNRHTVSKKHLSNLT